MSTFEGYIRIDHRDSPGFSEEDSIMRRSVLPFAGPGQVFECATNTCSHCDRIVIRNPDRVRERGHCHACNYFICDGCATTYHLTGECRCRTKRHDEIIRGVIHGT